MWAKSAVFGGILAVGLAVGGCGSGEQTESELATSAEELTASQSRVLGFEAATTDWRTSAGTLSSSTTHSQGSTSLGIRPNGWTELTSVRLSGLGDVNNTFKYDIRIPSTLVWGETRAIVMVPSRGIYWAELGSKDLKTLPVGSFQTVTFSIPASLEAVLDGAYSDLTIKIVVNAQTLTQPYLIDNVQLAAPGGTGGTGGTGGASGGGATRTFTVLRPTGVNIDNTFMSATDHLSFFSQATIGQSGKTPALASFGGTTQTYLQSLARTYANVYSVPNVQLDSSSRVDGFIRTRGTVTKQGVGTANAPVVTGGEFPGVNVLPIVTSWSVTEPTTNAGDVFFPAVTTIQNHTVPPGSYAAFNIHDRNRVFLSSGTYFFTSFNTEPLAEVWLNKTNGPIVIYVRDSFTYKGKFVENGGPVGRLVVGYSGTSDAFLQAPFVGTIVAPSATIKLERPTSAQHVGSFYGKGVEVAAGLHTVLHGPFNFDFLCSRGDKDADGVSDCTDICNTDPDKVTPGICGCNTPDTDSDNDGVANCIDECPLDASAQFKGTCGCPSDPAPNGLECGDSACRGVFSCTNGVCGNPNTCKPDASCQLRFSKESQHFYWFCTTQVTWEQARTTCGAVDGRKLVQIDSLVENAFVAKNVGAVSMWTGANDRTTDGEWFWNSHADDTGDKFWTAGAAGKPYFARFNAWSGSAPPNGLASCGRVSSNALWTAAPCADTTNRAGYVCELGLDRGTDIPFPKNQPLCTPGVNCPEPPGTDCQTEAEAFGGLNEAQVLDAFSTCQKACEGANAGTPACLAACNGPATPPSATDTCEVEDASDFTASGENCGENFDVLVPNVVCNSSTDCPAPTLCTHEYAGAGPTSPRLCATPLPCSSPVEEFPRCKAISLCEGGPNEHTQTVDSIEEGTSDLTPVPFNPQAAFGDPVVAPTTPYPPDNNPCSGSCAGQGQNHPWCKLDTEGTSGTLPARGVAPDKHGESNGSIINFAFDPKFHINHDAHIGAFGLPRLEVKAEAGVFAGVSIHLPPINKDQPIVDLLLSLHANQCGLDSFTRTTEIFGVDFIDAAGITIPDLRFPAPELQETCNKAYTDFEEAGNRAKKALRDATELLKQYKALVANDGAGTVADNLSATLCREIAANPPRGFPPGLCPPSGTTEAPEATINRFIQYYRQSILGFATPGIRGLGEVLEDLKSKAKAFTAEDTFPIIDFGEVHTYPIISAQFFIGPIPVFLDADGIVDYGVTVNGRAGFNAGPVVDAIFHTEGDMPAEQVAFVGVEGSPHAGAGLGLFAGVGFGVPGFKVKIGIAAELQLGTVYLPAYAGAGLGLGAEVDSRPQPVDIAGFTTGVNLIPAKRFVADVRYKAGLTVKVRNILNGSVSGKLKISVLFFSKTWKKTLFSFHGICAGDELANLPDCDFKLVSLEGSTDAASGSFPWAEVRMPTTFPDLALLTPGAAPTGTGTVDKSIVEDFFFDSQCQCYKSQAEGETRECFRSDDCCDAFPVCFPNPGTLKHECITCRNIHQNCTQDSDCCGDIEPGSTLPADRCNGATGTCEARRECYIQCASDADCATGSFCSDTHACDRPSCTPH